ncbi:PREDICTED: succinate-semialdehyde dehydrogenase, mitochondrial [Populus euphratica]|uniref:Succinate-semialdehyde dehydrogenase, mitochondrial n=1 Tax=Populus euphratica TaxID=75702 RepID=A0AAJ6UDN0_POPEU|nr:PREDICTED: succinate-semialdehyde dehydrogenase, mitochondrial [Populus euphratica]
MSFKGVLNVVMRKTPDIGDASCASPAVRKITFAGSTAVGKKLMAGAAETVKRLASRFRNSGQTCVCANRIIGQEGIFDKFADAFSKAVQSMQVGDGFSEGVAQIGGECALTSRTGLGTNPGRGR